MMVHFQRVTTLAVDKEDAERGVVSKLSKLIENQKYFRIIQVVILI